jgi:hypothetical protein
VGECTLEAANCSLVNRNSAGKLLTSCGAVLGAGENASEAHNAVSSDGSRVFFTAPDPLAKNDGAECWNGTEHPPQLYLRTAGTTVLVSAPEAGVEEEYEPGKKRVPVSQPVHYVGASEDGARVFFLTRAELTKDDQGFHDIELYEYDVGTRKLTRISAADAGDVEGQMFSVKAISAAGTVIYFEASGRLTAAAPPVLPAGEVYLYRYALDASGNPEIKYIANTPTREATNGGEGGFDGLEQPNPAPRADWYTTPDGRYLLFATSQQLTSYSTAAACAKPPETEESTNGHCEELYRYDANEPLSEGHPGVPENPVCVSCNPSGAPPVSHARFTRSGFSGLASGAMRSMSDNGSYVFFDTSDALVAGDTNRTQDVYEWHDSRVSLISSGADRVPSFFLGASPDGANVFFGTHSNLVPQDTDTAGDVYDARICSQVDPCIKPRTGGTALCEGDACAGSPATPSDTTPATLLTPGAATFADASSRPPKVSVVTRTAKGPKFGIRVLISSAGTLAVSGSSVRVTKKLAKAAGTYTLTVALTHSAKGALRRHPIKVKLRVAFTPTGGGPIALIVSVTVRP